MEKIISKLRRKKLRKTLISYSKKLVNDPFKKAVKYAFALFVFINVVSAAGLYLETSLPRKPGEQAQLGLNRRLEKHRLALVSEINENIAFLEIAPIALPSFEAPAKKNLSVQIAKIPNSEVADLMSVLGSLKKVVTDSIGGRIAYVLDGSSAALPPREPLLFDDNKIIENISPPTIELIGVAQIDLPRLEVPVEKRISHNYSESSESSDSVALTLQSAVESVRKVISQTFEKVQQDLPNRSPSAPPIDRTLFEGEAVSNSESVRAAQSNLAPSLAPVMSSLRNEVARYVELEFSARESSMLATIRNSMARQSDADANRRSVIVNNITQNADFTNPDITGGTITGTIANLASLSGAGLTNCESNNVLTWSDGQFGCEADDSGGGAGGTGNSKWATSTPTTDITPNGAIGVVMTRSTTTNATTTTFFATTASSTNLFAASANIGVLNFTSCSGCGGGSASSTLHSDNNTFSGANIFNSITRSTTTSATSTNLFATTASSTNLFATAATLGNATIGAITASSFNGLTISSSAGTLTIPASASLIRSGGHSLTLTTSGNTVATFPSGTIILADLSSTQTFTGAKIFDSITRSTTTSATTTRFDAFRYFFHHVLSFENSR
jgi:hypothetical protein